MNKLAICAVVLALAALACGGTASVPTAEPATAVAPLVLGNDLSQLDVCGAIPREDIEAIMGRKLSRAPEVFTYYDDNPGTESGCWYEAAQDSDGEAHFGYVVFTSVESYKTQPLYLDEAVPSLGEDAYFNNGADARQLWVKVNDSAAFVVAFGDIEREAGSLALARLILAAIQ